MTTANNDVKYVTNLAKNANGLTESEIEQMEMVDEDAVVVQPIIPEVPPTAEEIEQMEKVEVLDEESEVQADADFPSRDSRDAIGEESGRTQGDIEVGGSIESSDISSDDFHSEKTEEFYRAIEEFDNITIDIDDVKAAHEEADDFKNIKLNDTQYAELISIFETLKDNPNINIREALSEDLTLTMLTAAKADSIDVNNSKHFEFFVESFIREVCGNAYLNKGNTTLQNAIKTITESDEGKELGNLVEDFIENIYEERITKLNDAMDATEDTEVIEKCIEALNANEFAKTGEFIIDAIARHKPYLNPNRANKNLDRNHKNILDMLEKAGITNIDVNILRVAIKEFTSLHDDTIFTILLEILSKETSISDRMSVVRLYSMLLFLNGAVHAQRNTDKPGLNEFYSEVAFGFQKVCETIYYGYTEYATYTTPVKVKTTKRKK